MGTPEPKHKMEHLQRSVGFIEEKMSTLMLNDSSSSSTLDNLNHYMAQTKYLFTIAYALNLILGLPTNVYVLWLIVTKAGGKMASEFFSLNLTVSEILYCLFNVLVLLDYYLMNGLFLPARAFSVGFLSTSRPLFQCCICVERYLAVVHPVTFLKYKPLRYRVGCCGVVWLMVLGSCCVNMLDNDKSAWWKFFGLIINLLTLSVMLFCCLAVLWALKRPGPGEGEREGEGMNNMKLRAFRIISIIMVSMVVMYLPLVLLLVSYHFIEPVEFWGGWSICSSIAIMSGLVHPLLFLHRSGKLPFVRGP